MAIDRKSEILKKLKESYSPISASALAKELGVSRQIIVGDVALLRASGEDIQATPRGYVLHSPEKDSFKGIVKTIACHHDAEGMLKELYICVDNGCEVLDVIVEHPIYGQLIGPLQISSRYEVNQFVEKVKKESAHSLSELTDGIHLHTILCPDEESFERVHAQLVEAGIVIG